MIDSETAANDDMIDGYMDGFSKDAVWPSHNRSASYIHGWLNGRDDSIGSPRDLAVNLRSKAIDCMALDNLAGI